MNKNELYRVSEELSLEDLIKEFMTGKKNWCSGVL
jgi:hypothetical protein